MTPLKLTQGCEHSIACPRERDACTAYPKPDMTSKFVPKQAAAAWAPAYRGGSGVGLGYPVDMTLGAGCSIA